MQILGIKYSKHNGYVTWFVPVFSKHAKSFSVCMHMRGKQVQYLQADGRAVSA